MRMAVKCLGILATVMSFSAFGFLKARRKSDEIAAVKLILSAFSAADSMLRTGGYSREIILKTAFLDVPGFGYKNGVATLGEAAGSEISGFVNAFFADFGAGDAVRERGRIAAVRGEIQGVLSSREESAAAEGRIWRTCGICAGLILGIMFI